MTRAEAYLAELGRFGVAPDLGRIRRLLAAVGDPHRMYPVIHVAGTNGKGSVCTLLAAVLHAAGFRTGLYTSPHLHRFHERIAVDGIAIGDDALEVVFAAIRPHVEVSDPRPTQFDVGTAMAFLHFARERVDVAVIETGLGGVWDSTNVVEPALSVITPIDVDHADVLGGTLQEVAKQKAGIIKPGVPVVIAPQAPEVLEELLAHASACGSPVLVVEPAVEAGAPGCPSERAAEAPTVVVPEGAVYRVLDWNREGGRFAYRSVAGGAETTYRVGMLGLHQILNAAVVVACVDRLRRMGWRIPEAALQRGLVEARTPGRLEWFPGRPALLFDGAHNAHAAQQLALALGRIFAGSDFTFVCGISSDKDPSSLIAPLASSARRWVFTAATESRVGAWDPRELVARLQHLSPSVACEVRTSPVEALETAVAITPPDGVVCVWGSLYLVGELRGYWIRRSTEADQPVP